MGQKYALNRNRTGLRMAFRSKIDPVTGLPLHRHFLKLPGKWKKAVSGPRKWRFPRNILRETSWQNPRSRPYCARSHHLHLNRRQYRLAYSNPRDHCDNSKFLKQNPKHRAETGPLKQKNIEGCLYSRKSFICLHTPFSRGNRSKLFFKECSTCSTSPAMLQGEGAVWNLLEFLSDNFGFFFFYGVPFCASTCDGQAIFTSHSIM